MGKFVSSNDQQGQPVDNSVVEKESTSGGKFVQPASTTNGGFKTNIDTGLGTTTANAILTEQSVDKAFTGSKPSTPTLQQYLNRKSLFNKNKKEEAGTTPGSSSISEDVTGSAIDLNTTDQSKMDTTAKNTILAYNKGKSLPFQTNLDKYTASPAEMADTSKAGASKNTYNDQIKALENIINGDYPDSIKQQYIDKRNELVQKKASVLPDAQTDYRLSAYETNQLQPESIEDSPLVKLNSSVDDVKDYQSKVTEYEKSYAKTKSLQRIKEADDYVNQYASKLYEINPDAKDFKTIVNVAKANFYLGRVSLDAGYAYDDYLSNPTKENKIYAETLSKLKNKLISGNTDALTYGTDFDGVSGTLAETLRNVSSWIPQGLDQLKVEAPLVLASYLSGLGIVGSSLLTSTVESANVYRSIRGNAFENLLENGVDEELAKNIVKDEAVLSTIVETGSNFVQLLLRLNGLGAGTTQALSTGNQLLLTGETLTKDGILGVISKGTLANGIKVIQKAFDTNTATKLIKYSIERLADAFGEAMEEVAQDSIENADVERGLKGEDGGIWNLTVDAFNDFITFVKTLNKENISEEQKQKNEKKIEAGKAGFEVGLFAGTAESTLVNLFNNAVNNAKNPKAKKVKAEYVGNKFTEKENVTPGYNTIDVEYEVKNDIPKGQKRLTTTEETTDQETRKLLTHNEDANNVADSFKNDGSKESLADKLRMTAYRAELNNAIKNGNLDTETLNNLKSTVNKIDSALGNKPTYQIEVKALPTTQNETKSTKNVQGKKIGDSIVYHASMIDSSIDAAKNAPIDSYDLITADTKTGDLVYTKTDDFNGKTEPLIIQQVAVHKDGSVEDITPKEPTLITNKGELVPQDYNGFNVKEALDRQSSWQSAPQRDRSLSFNPQTINKQSNFEDLMNRISSKDQAKTEPKKSTETKSAKVDFKEKEKTPDFNFKVAQTENEIVPMQNANMQEVAKNERAKYNEEQANAKAEETAKVKEGENTNGRERTSEVYGRSERTSNGTDGRTNQNDEVTKAYRDFGRRTQSQKAGIRKDASRLDEETFRKKVKLNSYIPIDDPEQEVTTLTDDFIQYDEELKSIKKQAEDNGYDIVFFLSNIKIDGVERNGFRYKNTIGVRVDSYKTPATNLYNHEELHAFIKGNPNIVYAIIDTFNEAQQGKFLLLANEYIGAYQSIGYQIVDDDKPTNKNTLKIVDVFEETLCRMRGEQLISDGVVSEIDENYRVFINEAKAKRVVDSAMEKVREESRKAAQEAMPNIPKGEMDDFANFSLEVKPAEVLVSTIGVNKSGNKENREIKNYLVSINRTLDAQHKDHPAEIEIKTYEQAEEVNTNPERRKDWMEIYKNATKITKFSGGAKLVGNGKLLDVPQMILSKGCQRAQVTVERIENGVLPHTTAIEACYGGNCWVDVNSYKQATWQNVDVRDLEMADPEQFDKWLSNKSNVAWLNSFDFVRHGARGDDSHTIASGLALKWMEACERHGVVSKQVFISASYAPTTIEDYEALAKYKDQIMIHFSNSGWFHRNEIMIRLNEFRKARKAGIPCLIRKVSNKDLISGVEMPNADFLEEKIAEVMEEFNITRYESILATPFHDDNASGRPRSEADEIDQKESQICCEPVEKINPKTGKIEKIKACRTCMFGCGIRSQRDYSNEYIERLAMAYHGEEKDAKTKFSTEFINEINNVITVDKSMSMDKAERMIISAKNLLGLQKLTLQEYLEENSNREIALTIDSNETLYFKYLANLDDISVEDIIESYRNGTLVGPNKKTPFLNTIDTSYNHGYEDDKFYAPKQARTLEDKILYSNPPLFDIADQRLTKSNKEEVMNARKTILFASHYVNDVEQYLGLTPQGLNKKLSSWSYYPVTARKVSMKLNEGVADDAKWSGIENSANLIYADVTDEDIKALVKDVKGDSTNDSRYYIGRTMMALDTHINWSRLSFEFKRGFADEEHKSWLGFYKTAEERIVVGSRRSLNTIAHEMGHALDHLWGRELTGYDQYLTDVRPAFTQIKTSDAQKFFDHFVDFMGKLTDVNDISSSYAYEPKEVFARFVAKFVEWVQHKAGGKTFSESAYYEDEFSDSMYVEFVKLLQEKAYLDSAYQTMSHTREDLLPYYPIKKNSNNSSIYANAEELTDEDIQALNTYKSSESYKLNSMLREGVELPQDYQGLRDKLDVVLKKLPVYKGRVYRNLTFDMFGGKDEFDKFVNLHKVGEYVSYKAYTSTSIRKDGYEVDGQYVVHLVIDSKNGHDLEGYAFNDEFEVLFERELVANIKNVEYNNDGSVTIYEEEVYEDEQQISGTVSGDNRRGQGKSGRSIQSSMQQMQEENDEPLREVSAGNTDEIPARNRNLQGQEIGNKLNASITEERLDYLIDDSGAGSRTDYAKEWITTINPEDFLKLTTNQFILDNFDDIPGDRGKTVKEFNYIEGLKNDKRITPYLSITKDGQVVDHDGRHRMRALSMNGITNTTVIIEFRTDDGYIAKTLNGEGNPLHNIESVELKNQFDLKYVTTVKNVIPINESTREEILNTYVNKDSAIKYSTEFNFGTVAEVKSRLNNRPLNTILKRNGITDRTVISDYLEAADEDAKKYLDALWDSGKVSSAGYYTLEQLRKDYLDAKNDKLKADVPADDAYIKLAESYRAGDFEPFSELNRMVEEKALESGAIGYYDWVDAYKTKYRPIRLYHGTPTFGFTRFNTDDIYMTDSEFVAETYSDGYTREINLKNEEYGESGNYELFLLNGNYLVVDAQGRNWNEIPFEIDGEFRDDFTTRDIADYARANGYDGVIFNRIIDQAKTSEYAEDDIPHTVYAIFDKTKVHSADPVTYDDNGNIIPLSKRFSEDEDIRYSVSFKKEELKQAKDNEAGVYIHDTKGFRATTLITQHKKTIETRNNRNLDPLLGKRVAIVRTMDGRKTAIVGAMKFKDVKEYHSAEEFYADSDKHLIYKDDPTTKEYHWKEDTKVKYGYIISTATSAPVQPLSADYARTRTAVLIKDVLPKARFGTFFSGMGQYESPLRSIINSQYAVELEDKIAEVYRTNHGDWMINEAIQDVPSGILEYVDFMHGSPVCHNFSSLKTNASEEPLDILTAQALATKLRDKMPAIFTLENVPGYESSDAVRLIKKTLNQLGYGWDEVVVNAADYGAATTRDRYFIRALRDYNKRDLPPLPEKTKAQSWYDVAGDLIEEMPILEEDKTRAKPFPDWIAERLQIEKNKKKFAEKQFPIFILDGTPEKGLRFYGANEPIGTIAANDTDARVLIKNDDGSITVRKATAKMLARIQGLPDDFVLPTWGKKKPKVNESLAIKVIGNGIPPALTEAIAIPLLDKVGFSTGPRFSTEFTQENFDSLKQQLKDLKKDFTKAKARIKELTKQREHLHQQMNLSKYPKFTMKSALGIATELATKYNSLVDINDIAGRIKRIAEDYLLSSKDYTEEDWNTVLTISRNIAIKIVDKSVRVIAGDVQTYYDLYWWIKSKKFSIPQSVKDKLNAREYNGYNNWKNANFGYITISNNGTPISEIYNEARAKAGDNFFPEDITDEIEMVDTIVAVMTSIKPILDNPVDTDKPRLVNMIGNEVLAHIMYGDGLELEMTFADKQRAKLNQAYKDIADLKKEFKGKLKQVQDENDAEIKEILEQAKREKNEAVREVYEYFKKKRAEERAKRRRRNLENVVIDLVRRAKHYKGRETDVQNFYEIVKDIDDVAKNLTEKERWKLEDLKARYEKRRNDDPINFIKNPGLEEKFERLNQKHIGNVEDFTDEELQDLADILTSMFKAIRERDSFHKSQLKISVGIAARNARIGVRKANVPSTFKNPVSKGYNLMMLNSPRLINLVGGYDETNPIIILGDELFIKGTVDEQAYHLKANQQYFGKFLNDKKFMQNMRGSKAKIDTIQAHKLDFKATYNELTGNYEFYDFGTKESLQGKSIGDMINSIDSMYSGEIDKNRLKFDLRVWSSDAERRKKNFVRGKLVDVKVTRATKMQLAAYYDDNDAKRHIAGDGVRLPDLESSKKLNFAKAIRESTNIYAFEPRELYAMKESLTDKEKEYILACQMYQEHMAKPAINEVTEELYGYSVAKQEYGYLPIHIDPRYITEGISLEQGSRNKELVYGWLYERTISTKPMLITDLFDLMQRSVNENAKFVSYAIPINNFNRVYYDSNGIEQEPLSSIIIDKFGADVEQGIRDAVEEIISSPRPRFAFFNNLARSFKGKYSQSVLYLNIGVALTQICSYYMAMPYIDDGCLVSALTHKNIDQDIIHKYSPLQWTRTIGYSTIEQGEITKGYGNKNVPMGLNWNMATDIWTTEKLWTASELQVRKDMPQLWQPIKEALKKYKTIEDAIKNKVLTQEQVDTYFYKVADLHTRILTETQPMYNNIFRPEVLKEGDLAGMFTMFKTEQFQMYGMIIDSKGRVDAAKKAVANANSESERAKAKAELHKAKKAHDRTLRGALYAAIAIGVIRVLRNLIRNKFKGKDDEYILKSFAIDVMSSIMGMGFGGDVLAALTKSLVFGEKWYDQSFWILDIVNDTYYAANKLVNFAKKFDKGQDTLEDVADTAVSTFSLFGEFMGIPVQSIYKDMSGIISQLE